MRNNEPLAFLHSVLHFSFEIANIAGVFFVACRRNLPSSIPLLSETRRERSFPLSSSLQRLITSSYALFIPSFNVLNSYFYVSLSLVITPTVWILINFVALGGSFMSNPFCQHCCVSLYNWGGYNYICLFLVVFFSRMCVFEGHNLFSGDETCNQSPLIRYLLNTLYKDQRNVLVNFDRSGLEMLLNCNCMCTVILRE